MEGLLARWALAMQEYEFTINYCRGHEDGNADALSRKVYPDTQLIAATSQIPVLTESLHEQHLTDPVIQALHLALAQTSSNHTLPQGPNWRQSPFSRYKQLWSQLCITKGIVCHHYAPNPQLPVITVPLIPVSNCLKLIKQHRASAEYLGYNKTVSRIRQVGLVGML